MTTTDAKKTGETSAKTVWAIPAKGTSRALGLERFEKELIRVGTFTHPEKKFTLKVTPERLAEWSRRFYSMKAAGIKVPVPYGHSYDPRDNAGFVEEMWVEEGRLMGLLNVPRTDDAARLGATVADVSVSVNPDFADASGTRYGEVIEHVAMTNYPVVPAQENFKKAKVLDGVAVEVIQLERFSEEDGMERKDEVGQTPATPPAGEAGKANLDGAEAVVALSTRLERTEAEKGEAIKDLDAANKELAKLRLERVEREVGGLIETGKIVASDENKADVAALLSAEGPGAMQLSVKSGEKETQESPGAVFRRFLSRIPKGAVVELGAKTGSPSGDADDEETPVKEARKNLDAAGIKRE